MRYIPRLCSAVVFVIGALVLIGWFFQVEALKSVFPGLSSMKPNTAFAFILSGASLWLLIHRTATGAGRVVAQGLGAAVAAIGGLTIIEYASSLDFGIDQVLFPDPSLLSHVAPGRMGVNAATGLVAGGLSLTLTGLPRRASQDAAQLLGLAAAGIAAIGFVGYAYNVRALYAFDSYMQMAIHTAVALMALGIGVATVAPHQGAVGVLTSGGPGGALARRLLPAVILGPLALGWLRLEGQRAGWYGTEFGAAILAGASAFVFAIVVLVHAIGVDRAEAAKHLAEETRRESQRILEASRLKNAFMANMSHELRTPLNAIIGFADLMYKGKVGEPSPEHKEYLGDILTSSRHLHELINDVLDLAKVESGTMTFQPEPADGAKLVGEVNDTLRGLAGAKRLRVDVEIDPEVAEVVVDPARVKQMLYNYLSNAIKFTAEDGRIRIRLTPEGPALLRIAVEDTGIGIAAEHLSKLFVEFQQLDGSIAKRYQGTGLGLALTKRLAEAQGGHVGVESTPGVGSTFTVVIPRIPPTPHPPSGTSQPSV